MMSLGVFGVFPRWTTLHGTVMLAALLDDAARVLAPIFGNGLVKIVRIDLVARQRLGVHRKIKSAGARDGHRLGTFLGAFSGVTFLFARVTTTF